MKTGTLTTTANTIQFENSSVKISNVDGYLVFTDGYNPAGKLMSQLGGSVTTASLPQRVAPDANTLLYYDFSETGTTFANTGFGGDGYNMTIVSGGDYCQGGINGPTFKDGKGAIFLTGSGTSKIVVTPNFNYYDSVMTFDTWVQFNAFATYNNEGYFIYKQYYSYTAQPYNGWDVPFCGFLLYFALTGFNIFLTIDGTFAVYFVEMRYFSLYTPIHLGFTYGDGFVKVYINGKLAKSFVKTGTLTLGVGPLRFGGDANQNLPYGTGFTVEEIRLSNVIRDAVWFQNTYLKGIGRSV
jgi:hypothetical protein